jgi:hypothetical protein
MRRTWPLRCIHGCCRLQLYEQFLTCRCTKGFVWPRRWHPEACSRVWRWRMRYAAVEVHSMGIVASNFRTPARFNMRAGSSEPSCEHAPPILDYC